jgi:hypothetical protein
LLNTVRAPGRTFLFYRASAESAVHGGRFRLLRAFDFAERHGSGVFIHLEIVPQASALPACWTAARFFALLTFLS